jgi:type IV fimbrial biogenesis protein FimT
MRTHTDAEVGFTLIESMIAVSVLAILFSLAFPSFSNAITNSRLTSQANLLVSAINQARSEAIRRGQHVVVRKINAEWESGWRVFVDVDRATNAKKNIFDSGTDIQLSVHPALPTNFTLRGNRNFVNFIRYQPNGDSNNIGSFVLCESGHVEGAKLLIVNSIGRVRVALDTNHNRIPENDQGSDIVSCFSGF